MKAFILAAGLGTRLRPLTDKQPKVMLEVGGKKILERTLEQLKKAGINEVIINTHYFPEIIRQYFGSGEKWGIQISYSHELELLGTAGAVKKMELELQEPFLVVYGDNIFDVDFISIMNSPITQGISCLITLFNRNLSPNSGAAGGVVEVDQDMTVKGFWEGLNRPDIPYVNGGLYYLTPEIFKHIPENVFYDFGKDVFPKLLQEKISIKTYLLPKTEAVFGVDTLEYLEKAKQYFANK